MNKESHVGILGYGISLPAARMKAEEIAAKTGGVWSAQAIREKLGINQIMVPDEGVGTQELGVRAALDALARTGLDPLEIDLILCVGEEWKEYPLTTSGIYIQERIGAVNAWAIDVQQRCASTISAMKIAKDMMLSDGDISVAMIVGGYRNGDFVDFQDRSMSMMFNLAAAGGALLLKRDIGKNVLLGTQVVSDGSMARDAGVVYGGQAHPIDAQNLGKAYKSLTLMDEAHMKARLNDVSMKNWFHCIDKAFQKSGIDKRELGYLAILHIKPSMHSLMLKELGLSVEQSFYLEDFGHAGQIDQVLSLHLGLVSGRLRPGMVLSMIAAGIGYAWAANVVRWG